MVLSANPITSIIVLSCPCFGSCSRCCCSCECSSSSRCCCCCCCLEGLECMLLLLLLLLRWLFSSFVSDCCFCCTMNSVVLPGNPGAIMWYNIVESTLIISL